LQLPSISEGCLPRTHHAMVTGTNITWWILDLHCSNIWACKL